MTADKVSVDLSGLSGVDTRTHGGSKIDITRHAMLRFSPSRPIRPVESSRSITRGDGTTFQNRRLKRGYRYHLLDISGELFFAFALRI